MFRNSWDDHWHHKNLSQEWSLQKLTLLSKAQAFQWVCLSVDISAQKKITIKKHSWELCFHLSWKLRNITESYVFTCIGNSVSLCISLLKWRWPWKSVWLGWEKGNFPREETHWLDTQATFYSYDPQAPNHGDLSRLVVCTKSHKWTSLMGRFVLDIISSSSS